MYEGLIVSFSIFILLGIVSYIGALYSAKKNSPLALISIYILFLALAQFFAAKTHTIFDFGIFSVVAPAGVIVFPFTFQLTDMVNEKFGKKAVYEMIWIAFVSQVIMIFLLILAIYVPLDDFWTIIHPNDPDPLIAFAIVPAITLASWISFLISERFDAWIYDKIKKWISDKTQGGKEWWKYLWIRNVFSDIISLGLDTILFIPLAFYIFPSIQNLLGATEYVMDTIELIEIIFGQLFMKWLLGLIDTPYMYLTRWVYDKNIDTVK